MNKIEERAEVLRTRDGLDDATKAMLSEIDMRVQTEGVTLPSLIREGSTVSDQAIGDWGDGSSACALTAAAIAAKARNLI
jgi:5-enolpyruvylshikimate-3-phosphate synthase